MKLTIRRDQADVKGILGGHKGVNFSLHGKCEITDEEKALIAKYKVGGYVLATYEKQAGRGQSYNLRISVDDILAGERVETDDINTLLELEEAMKSGCGNLKNLLAVMATFGGEEVLDI